MKLFVTEEDDKKLTKDTEIKKESVEEAKAPPPRRDTPKKVDFSKGKGETIHVDGSQSNPSGPNLGTAKGQVEKQAATAATTAGVVQSNEGMAEHLYNKLKENTSVSISYLGFIETVNGLPDMPGVPEQAKYAMAFGTLKQTSAITKQSLLNSITEDLRTLEKERTEFHKAMKSQLDATVNSEQKAIEELEARKEEIQKQLQELGAELQDISDEIAQNQVDIQNAQYDIDLKDQEFDATVNMITEGIHLSEQKIQDYITE